jgi:hypothetical protein
VTTSLSHDTPVRLHKSSVPSGCPGELNHRQLAVLHAVATGRAIISQISWTGAGSS